MYEDASGAQSVAPAYIDDMTLAESLNAMLRGGPLTAHLYVCDPLAPGADRRLLASEAQAAVDAALRRMQGEAVAPRAGQAGIAELDSSDTLSSQRPPEPVG
jgi:1-acyl-sn-glycerol-3-phosphate acyltransferase